jgi:diaminopimelate epimerase
VEFIKVLNDKELRVAFWERGVGVSYASGTGSCGATVAAIFEWEDRTASDGLYGRGQARRGVAGEMDALRLTSTATIVAEGQYFEKS